MKNEQIIKAPGLWQASGAGDITAFCTRPSDQFIMVIPGHLSRDILEKK